MAEPQIYDQKWFKNRAFSSLKRINDNSWDYSDSLLLYVSSGVETYETLQETNSPYFNLITKPERNYLESIATVVVKELPSNFEYIDLGPGTEHKEQFFFDELKKQGKQFTYFPVDISQYYLDLSAEHATKQNIPVKTVQASFEELAERLGPSNVPRFVNLGLTFSNYEPEFILPLLKTIAGNHGFVFINAHMRDRVDMVALQKVYAIDALNLADEKLLLLGLDPVTDVTEREATDSVEVWCRVINSNKELETIGIKNGDKLLVLRSLRYTTDSLQEALENTSSKYQLFDTGAPFISTLIRT